MCGYSTKQYENNQFLSVLTNSVLDLVTKFLYDTGKPKTANINISESEAIVVDTLVLNADAQPLTVLPIATNNWQDAIKAQYQGDVEVLELYENWIVRSPSVELHVPAVIMLHNYINVRKDVKFSKQNVYLRDDYTCQYCGLDCHEDHGMLTYDHVNPRNNGGKTTWTNIVAACKPCNHSKGSSLNWKKPAHPAYRPEYGKLAYKAKQKPIVIPHESWIPFLAWEGTVTLNKKAATVTELPRR